MDSSWYEKITSSQTQLIQIVQAIAIFEAGKQNELSTFGLNPDFLILNLVSAANNLTDLFVSLGQENSFLELITEDLQEKIEYYCGIPIPILFTFPGFEKESGYSIKKQDEIYLNYLSEKGLFDPKSLLETIKYLQFKLNNIEIEFEQVREPIVFTCTNDFNNWYKNWLMPEISNLLTLTTQAINKLEEKLNREQLALELPEIDTEPEAHSIEFWEYYIIDRIKGSLAHETFIDPNGFTRGEIVKIVKMANKLNIPSMMVKLTERDSEIHTNEPLWVQRLSSSLANLKKLSIIHQVDRLHYRFNEQYFGDKNEQE